MQGSVDVLQQLMKFDLSIVTASRNRTSESTPLHLAAEGGHADVVKMLLEAGALPQDENKVSLLPFVHHRIFEKIQFATVTGRIHSHSIGSQKRAQCSHRRLTRRQSRHAQLCESSNRIEFFTRRCLLRSIG